MTGIKKFSPQRLINFSLYYGKKIANGRRKKLQKGGEKKIQEKSFTKITWLKNLPSLKIILGIGLKT